MELQEAERVFGLSADASTREFVAVRKRLARLHHPDRSSPGPDRDAAERKMTEINAAFEQLRRERRRRRSVSGASTPAAASPTPHSYRPSSTALRGAVAIWLGIIIFLFAGALLVVVFSLHAVLALSASAVLGWATAVSVWYFPKIAE